MVCGLPRRDEILIFEGKIDMFHLSLDSLSSCHTAFGTYSQNIDPTNKSIINFKLNGLIKENSLVPLNRRKGDMRFQLQGTRKSKSPNFKAYGTVGKVTISPPGFGILLKSAPDSSDTPTVIGVTVHFPAKILLDQ